MVIYMYYMVKCTILQYNYSNPFLHQETFCRLSPAALAAALAVLRETPCQAHRAWCLTDRFKMCEDHQHGV